MKGAKRRGDPRRALRGAAIAAVLAAACAGILCACDSGKLATEKTEATRAGFRGDLPKDLSGRVLVVLDEAFAAARPSFLAALEAEASRRPPARRPVLLRLGFDESPALVVELLAGLEASAWPSGILFSPLVGLALAGTSPSTPTGKAGGGPAAWPARLVVEAALPPSMAEGSLDSDWKGAMALLGRAFGRHIARLRAREGGSPAAGLLLAEGRSGDAVVRAFLEAYQEQTGEEPLVEEVAGSGRGGQTSALEAGQAVARLRERDLRLVLVAAEDAGPAACPPLDAAGIPYGLVSSEEGRYPGGLFRLRPDDPGLVGAALEALRPRRAESAIGAVVVPALLRAPKGEEEDFLALLRTELASSGGPEAGKPRLDDSPGPWKPTKEGLLRPLRPISRP